MSFVGPAKAGQASPGGTGSDRGWQRAALRPRNLLFPAAVVLPLLLLGASAWLSWRQTWLSAEAEVTRTAGAAAEYARRVLDGLLLRADRTNELLAGLADGEIRAREAELHAALRALASRTGDAGTVHTFAHDRAGASLVSGEIFPVPPPSVTFQEREYAQSLRMPGAPQVHLGEVFVGQLLSRPFFVVARRREGGGNGLEPGEYDGLIAASADVNAIGHGLRRLLPSDAKSDVLALVRSDGHVLARSSGMDGPLPPLARTNEVARGMLEGRDGPDREVILRPSGVDGVERLAALRRVEGWPAFMSVARPRSAIVARWREAVALQLAFGFPATLALVGLALLARRREIDLAAANDSLERRVGERTAALEEGRAALAESEARFRAVFDSGLLGLSVFDTRTGRTLAINDRALEMLDCTREEFESGERDWRAATAPEHLHLDELAIRQFIEAGRAEPFEKEFVHKNGARVRVRLTLAPLPGQPGRVVVGTEDLTAQRAAERALRNGEARFRALVDVGPNFVWLATPDGALHYLNDRWYEFTGQRPEEALPDGWAAVLHPDDAGRTATTWAEARAQGVTYGIEVRYRRYDGEYRWYLARAEPLREDDGRISAWVGSSTDIHDLKTAQAALAESEARLRLAQEAGGVGSWEWDLETGGLFWSESCHRLHGTDPAAPITYETWRDGIHPEDLSDVEQALREALEGRATGWAIEFRFRRRDNGALRWIAGRAEVERDPATGRPMRVHGVGLDVTERHEADERLRLLAREVDHRAKNALAVVQAALRLTPKDDLKTYAAAVEGRVRALARAHTLLAEARWEGAALRSIVEAELAAFLPTAGGADTPRAELNGLALTLTPAAAQALSMALHELATNAVKYGALSAPGGQVAVSWVVDRQADALCIRWEEKGGPPIVAAPSRRGFGSRVLEGTVRDQLGGKVERHWEAEGLICDVTIPLAKVSTTGITAAAAQ